MIQLKRASTAICPKQRDLSRQLQILACVLAGGIIGLAIMAWRREAMALVLISAVDAGLVGTLLLVLAWRSAEIEALVGSLCTAKDAAERASSETIAELEERSQVERALRHAQRAETIGRLTGGVAHDFNNLLAVVMGNVDLLELTHKADPKTLARLATMRAAVERGATLTGQLLAFSRRQPLLPRPTDLNELVGGLRTLVQSAVGSRVKLQIALQEGLAPVMIDKAQVELAVLNLAINARDAMQSGGELAIGTGRVRLAQTERVEDPPPGEYALLSVSDTGCGMTADVVAKAFEPFFTTKLVGRGSGLGLSQVYGTAHQLGGGARIDSVPGKGTAVHVYFPLAMSGIGGASELPQCREKNPSSRPLRVLVVDDDPDVRATTKAILAEMGYVVLAAASGGEALAILEHEPMDVLLTDVVMPGMTGPELARRARERFTRLAIVFISGYADPGSLAGEDGTVHLVRKPFRPEDVIGAIERAQSAAAVA